MRDQERLQCTVPVLTWDQPGSGAGAGAGAGRQNGRSGQGGEHPPHPPGTGGDEGRVVVSHASVSVVVGDRATVWDEKVPYSARDCFTAMDCDDGDMCSSDACVEVSACLLLTL